MGLEPVRSNVSRVSTRTPDVGEGPVRSVTRTTLRLARSAHLAIVSQNSSESKGGSPGAHRSLASRREQRNLPGPRGLSRRDQDVGL